MAQPPNGPAPVPRQRTYSLLPQKKELVDLFSNFTSSAVEQRHEDLARTCISFSPRGKYQYVNLKLLLERNEDKPDHLSMMMSVFEFLMRYLINLLKPKRPQVWRSIRTSTASFQNRVDCMVGARDVLAYAGYSESVSGAVQFPDDVVEPDKRKLSTIAAELLIAKFEIEEMSKSPQRWREGVGNTTERAHTGSSGDSGYVRTSGSISNNFPDDGGDVYKAGDSSTYLRRESSGYNGGYSDTARRESSGYGDVPTRAVNYSDGRSGEVNDSHYYGTGGVNSAQQPPTGQGSGSIGNPAGFSSRKVYGQDGYESSRHQMHAGQDPGVIPTTQPGGRDHQYPSDYNDQYGGQASTQDMGVYSGDQGGRVAPSSSQAAPKRGVYSGDQGGRVAASSSQAAPRRGMYSGDQGGRVAAGSSQDHGGTLPSPRQNPPGHPVPAPRRRKTLSSSSSGSSIASSKPPSVCDDSCAMPSQSPSYDKPGDAYSSRYSTSHENYEAHSEVRAILPPPRPSLNSTEPGDAYSSRYSTSHENHEAHSEVRAILPPPRPSLNSTGTSGDSNVDPLKKNCDETRSRRQKELEEFRRKKARAMENAKAKTAMDVPISLSSDIGRKASTGQHRTARVEDTHQRSVAFNPPPSSPSLTSIKRPPQNSQQPRFSDDMILETNDVPTGSSFDKVPPSRPNVFEDNNPRVQPGAGRTQFSASTQDPPPSPQGVFCSNCHNKLSEIIKFCPHCGHQVPPRMDPNIGGQAKNLPPTDTPKPSFPRPRSQDLPLRADPNETVDLETAHRTRIMKIDGMGGLEPQIPRATPMNPVPSVTPVNRELSGIEQMRLKEEAQKKHLESLNKTTPPGGRDLESSRGFKQFEAKSDSTRPRNLKEHPSYPPMQNDGQGSRPPVAAAAAAATTPLSPKSGLDEIREKEEALKAHHRSQGKTEEELGEIVADFWRGDAENKALRERSQVAPPRGGVVPDKTKKVIKASELKNFAKESLMDNQYEKESKECEEMQQLGMIGQSLLEAIKFCSPRVFTLGEIQIAFKWSRNKSPGGVLQYLKEEWTNMTRNVCKRVDTEHYDGVRASVGMPTEKEAREVLVEVKGRINDAVYKIFCQRKEKIIKLLNKMDYMREVERSLPVLEWDAAVMALTRNGMDVDKTCLAIQAERLDPVYEYIFGEYTGVAKTEMEKVKEIISNPDEELYPLEARHHLLMAEYKIKEEFRAKMVLSLLAKTKEDNPDSNYPLNYFIDAAKDFNTLDEASNFLIKECPVCTFNYPIHEMVTMPGCADSLCKECFEGHFQIVIREQGVKHFNCPLCGLPDMTDNEATEGMYMDIFQAMIREHLDQEVYSLCMEKLKDYSLTKDPGFVWCPNDCRSGFIYDADVPRLPRDIQCPNCRKRMCLMCKKTWEGQHEGTTCEQFAKWKQDNDPDAQKQGLAAHLNANGIECPQCHMRYDLARGGCMHFRCTRCPNEFCSGCSKSFKNGKQCGKLKSCDNKGLHAHHPRDCLFYLRDKDVEELQQFLRENNVEFDVDLPEKQEAAMKEREEENDGEEENEELPGGAVAAKDLKCCVMLQKETPGGLIDEECGTGVQEGHAGLCMLHYKEYLVDKINKNKLDPITIYNTNQIKVMLSREELKVPVQNEDENREQDQTDEQFREILIQEVKRVLPLPNAKREAEDPLPDVPQPPDIEVEDLEEADSD